MAQGRGRWAAPTSPVAAAAARAGFALLAAEDEGAEFSSPSAPPLLCPASPKDEDLLRRLEAIAPDLCVTVAYGGLLNKRFLALPRRGTLNVHPSLLPRWRGTAPVQRTLAAGDAECGVSLAFTVLALDAGPVLASARLPTPARAAAPELLDWLMRRGGELLLAELPRVLIGESTFESATPQAEVERRERERRRKGKRDAALVGGGGEEEEDDDWSYASHAARLTREDGRIDPAPSPSSRPSTGGGAPRGGPAAGWW